MDLIADILLVAGALGASVYCYVLAQRLKRFNDLEKGVGGAVAVMSAQVDDMTKMLVAARETSGTSAEALEDLTGRAEHVAQRLELMIASLHDVPNALLETASAAAKPEAANADAAGTPDKGPVDQNAPDGVMFVRHARMGDG